MIDMVKREFAVLALLLFLTSMIPSAKAVIYDTTNETVITGTTGVCYGEDARDVMYLNHNVQNSTYCSGDHSLFLTSTCLRSFTLNNIDNKPNEMTIRIVPTACFDPVPSVSQAFVSFAPNGDNSNADTKSYDMKKCWNIWCSALGPNTTVTRCPFNLNFLNYFGICQTVNGTDENALYSDCPTATFKVNPDVRWVNVSFGWVNGNDWDQAFQLQAFTMSTSRRIKVISTDYQVTEHIAPSDTVFQSSIGNMLTMNGNFLSITYSIVEVVIIVVAVIMIPAIALLLIRFAFEKVTGRKISTGRRTRNYSEEDTSENKR